VARSDGVVLSPGKTCKTTSTKMNLCEVRRSPQQKISFSCQNDREFIRSFMFKAQAIEAIQALPDNANIDDIMYRLYIIDKIEQGKAAMRANKTNTVAELKNEIAQW
jgi:hypothetical protein